MGEQRADRADNLLAGKYRLDEAIAVGGMGTVWRATHVTLHRPVAVKFVDRSLHMMEKGADRFLREARLAAAIRHPNVIDILDFGVTTEGQPYMVMELLEGEPLSVRMTRAPLDTGQSISLMTQLLAGLDAVHRVGIVHRDLKPENIFVSTDEEDDEIFARLIDFGISHSVDPRSDLRRGRYGTDEGLVIGTPQYMSPEQAEGRHDVDARADVYSAGVILYELLTGDVPYDAEHSGAVLFKVMQGGCKPLVELRPDLAAVSEVVMSALDIDRDKRPETARDLRRRLMMATGQIGDLSGSSVGSISSPRLKALRLTPDRPTPSAAARARQQQPTLDPGAVDALPTLQPAAPVPKRSAAIVFAVGIVIALAAGGAWLWAGSTNVIAPTASAVLPSAVLPSAVLPSAAPVMGAATASTPAATETHTESAHVAVTPSSEVVAPSAAEPTPDEPTAETSARSRRRHGAARASATSAASDLAPPPAAPARAGVVHEFDF